ncbi:hypothetical protein [Sediminibacterium sp.]|uniref:hypothetical protein n=1 Tax=Sediminibacterium sp. TaxID=1917865 RepID=UPI003F70FC41
MLNSAQQNGKKKANASIFFERSENGELIATDLGLFALAVIGGILGSLIVKVLIRQM